ncbi:hypothetical protein EC142526_00015 [Escherichia coli O145:H28]|nr:hypothetical protein HmCmsJML105_01900 [Escherichia coli]GEE16182.1 hypothetical protein EC12188_02159 [Escherichia coli O145:H28]GEE35077.1 hypothetical protein EC131719_05089 [Escherichia coli O145:H28]GEE45431.1 hypothetical protein EC1380_04749 [Escherichia coli O145:H28]GEE66571.1 hypothetical protein EC1649_05152 [Escherichia coli O145:H28]
MNGNDIHIAVLVLRVGRLDKAIADRIKTIAHAIKHVVRGLRATERRRPFRLEAVRADGVAAFAVLSPCQLDVGGAVIDTNFHVAFPYVD